MQVSIGSSDIQFERNTIKYDVLTFTCALVSYMYLYYSIILLPLLYFGYKLFFEYNTKIIIKALTPNPNKFNGQYKGWYRICLSKELENGKIKTFKLLGTEIVIYRDYNSKINAIDAYCSHQGAHLGLGSICSNNNIRCAFHGWSFDGSGKCKTSIATLHESCKSAELDIKSWIVCEERGIIYLWYGSEDPLFDVPPMPNQNNIRHVGTVTFNMHSNIVDVAENHVDFLHFYWVHSKHNEPFGICFENKNPSKITISDDGYKLTIEQPAYIQIFGYRIMDFKSKNIINGLSIGEFSFLNFIYASLSIIPINESYLSATLDFYMPWYVPAFIAKIFIWIIAVGVPIDDIVIWNTKKFKSNPALIKNEYNNITSFRKYCERFQINDSKLFDW